MGSVPLKVPSSASLVICVRRPISVGSVPESRFWWRYSWVSCVTRPVSVRDRAGELIELEVQIGELREAANLSRQRAGELIGVEPQRSELRVLEDLGRYVDRGLGRRGSARYRHSRCRRKSKACDPRSNSRGRVAALAALAVRAAALEAVALVAGGEAEAGRAARWEGRHRAAERVDVGRAAAC